jgi:predicted DNA-binding transcriptional regulator AlpA
MISEENNLEVQNFDYLPNAAYVRLPVVTALFACSPATVWRRVSSGHIPKPRKLSLRITGWNVGELRQALGETQ